MKLDAEKSGMALAKKLKVSSYPAFFFLDANEKVIGSVMGYRDEVSWRTRVGAILGAGSEKERLANAIAKDAKDAESRARLAQLLASEGDAKAAIRLT